MADAPPAPTPDEPFQSLYRRYRPQRFEDVRGQEHVTRALRNAVRDDRVAHAYLFSGPRGTGKTSTARILAMALNCAHPVEGEPDGTCQSCVDIRRGASMDVHELDAASNRRLEEMRDLLSRVALGTSGRWKVYIVDEVHQLTADAASALLKTLEEPPAHVVFVLATTDPQKVLPTIRSRTQHFEFRLLGAEVLAGLLRDVNEQAALGLAPEAIDLVVRRGHGSARDALSVLDQVAAAGEVEPESAVIGGIADALADQDPGRVLMAVAEAMAAGRDPRRLATDLLDHLRNGFLATQARSLVHLPDDAVVEVEEQARRLGLAGVVKAMEVVGQAAVDMRESVDPRVTLEAALVRCAAPKLDAGGDAVLRRLDHLEAQLAALTAAGGHARAAGSPPPAAAAAGSAAPGPAVPTAAAGAPLAERPTPPPAPGPVGPPSAGPADPVSAGPRLATEAGRSTSASSRSAPPRPQLPTAGPGRPLPGGTTPPPVAPTDGPPAGTGPGASRPALGALRRARPKPDAVARPVSNPVPDAARPAPERAPSAPGPVASRAATGAPSGGLPSRDELTKAWGDQVLASLPPSVKVYVSAGRFVPGDGAAAVFAVPDRGLLARAQLVRAEVEAALGAHFGRPVPVRLILDGDSVPVPEGPPEEAAVAPEDDDLRSYDLDDLETADPVVVSPEQRLLEAFPGAEEVTQQ